ncbi:hypothetical protein BXZ70DRAFT_929478 [Cristinia sonorae]|uniref:Uncharacterized protein n=1 Tax=Cristinia sonorae TaxID=1940300 RepID=A0A8K0URZ6_9AGAR|nr:hypothetical protein BXZ70DRAFT_929478 [Cristinia sonorae]
MPDKNTRIPFRRHGIRKPYNGVDATAVQRVRTESAFRTQDGTRRKSHTTTPRMLFHQLSFKIHTACTVNNVLACQKKSIQPELRKLRPQWTTIQDFSPRQIVCIFTARIDSLGHARNSPRLYTTPSAVGALLRARITHPFHYFRDIALECLNERTCPPETTDKEQVLQDLRSIRMPDKNQRQGLLHPDDDIWWQYVEGIFETTRTRCEEPSVANQVVFVYVAWKTPDSQFHSAIYLTQPVLGIFSKRMTDPKLFFDSLARSELFTRPA